MQFCCYESYCCLTWKAFITVSAGHQRPGRIPPGVYYTCHMWRSRKIFIWVPTKHLKQSRATKLGKPQTGKDVPKIGRAHV